MVMQNRRWEKRPQAHKSAINFFTPHNNEWSIVKKLL